MEQGGTQGGGAPSRRKALNRALASAALGMLLIFPKCGHNGLQCPSCAAVYSGNLCDSSGKVRPGSTSVNPELNIKEPFKIGEMGFM